MQGLREVRKNSSRHLRAIRIGAIRRPMNKNARRNAFRAIAALAVWGACTAIAGPKNQELPWVQMQNGRLVYGTDAERNRIPDFSTAGYEEGDAPIPDVPVKMRVEALGDNAREQDATARIQSAIEAMSHLPLDEHGKI